MGRKKKRQFYVSFWSYWASSKSISPPMIKGWVREKPGGRLMQREKRKPTASLLRIHPDVGNHQRLFKCQYSPDAVWLCLARFEVCGWEKGQRGSSFSFHPQNHLTNSPDFVRAKQKRQVSPSTRPTEDQWYVQKSVLLQGVITDPLSSSSALVNAASKCFTSTLYFFPAGKTMSRPPEETERRETPGSRSSWAASDPLCPRWMSGLHISRRLPTSKSTPDVQNPMTERWWRWGLRRLKRRRDGPDSIARNLNKSIFSPLKAAIFQSDGCCKHHSSAQHYETRCSTFLPLLFPF